MERSKVQRVARAASGMHRSCLRPAGLAALAVFLSTGPAAAFCRSTTCDPALKNCRLDQNGCVVEGEPLFLPDGKLAISVSAEGSVTDGITGEETDQAAREAFATWRAVSCDDGL